MEVLSAEHQQKRPHTQVNKLFFLFAASGRRVQHPISDIHPQIISKGFLGVTIY
jgi:hypothetical protein